MTQAARLAWLHARLRNMTLAEVGHRVGELARKLATRRWRQGWARYASVSDGSCPRLPGLAQCVEGASQTAREQVAEVAAAFRAGHFAALGAEWPADMVRMDFPARLWRADPRTGREWPGAGHYCFDIAYRLFNDVGDIKHVWEFGRLQFLPLLAADFALNGDGESLSAVAAAIDSWYANNPPFEGVHWAELLNVAIRAISVLVALSLCGKDLPSETVARAAALLRAHAQLLALFPSRFSSANNHLVAELAAEYLIAVAMPDLPDAAVVRRYSREALQIEAERQLLADGVPAEQSPSYGAFTAEFILLVHRTAAAAGEPLSESALTRLAGFADHIQSLASASGHVPALCDNDEGRVLASGTREDDYPMAIAKAICAVLHRPFHSARRLPTRLRDLVFGEPEYAEPPGPGQRSCAEGGYSVDRRTLGGRCCVFGFDHGPLGYLSIAAHGHADALSVVLDVDGVAVLVDPGTYLYHAGGAWRDWFRSTPAHNTLNLGVDQSRMAGPFNWLTKANCRLGDCTTGTDWRWRASHDGYRRQFGLLHERSVEALADGYRITDRLVGEHARVSAQVVFQLAPGLDAIPEAQGYLVRVGDDAVLRLVFEAPGDLACARGGEPGQGGWVSPRFGVREAADRITWHGTVPAYGAAVRLHVLARRPRSITLNT